MNEKLLNGAGEDKGLLIPKFGTYARGKINSCRDQFVRCIGHACRPQLVALHPSLTLTTTTTQTMATAVQSSFSSLGHPSSSNGPTRSTPIEVIDVDLLSDDEVQLVGSRRSTRPIPSSSRRPEPGRTNEVPETILVIDDSDDETPSAPSARRGKK